MDPLLVTLTRAADAAARWHAAQRRKGANPEPYINHLLEVARLVAEATRGADLELVIAALLHDAIEDQDIGRAKIAELFGEDVATIVAEVTDDKTLTKEEQKRRQVEHAAAKSDRAKILKLADKVSNLKSIAANPPRDWSPTRRRQYVQWAREVALGLRGASPWLEAAFDQAANDAEQALTNPHGFRGA